MRTLGRLLTILSLLLTISPAVLSQQEARAKVDCGGECGNETPATGTRQVCVVATRRWQGDHRRPVY